MTTLMRFTTDIAEPDGFVTGWGSRRWPMEMAVRSAPERTETVCGSIGSIRSFRVFAAEHRVEPAAASRGLANLIVQRGGSSTVRQSNREVCLAPGSWTLCDADRAFTLASTEPCEQLHMLIPCDRLGIGSGIAAYVARNFGAAGGTARLLPRYLSSLFDELTQVADTNCSELADMAAQLVRLALLEARQATPPVSMSETLRLRVKDYVRRNLRDPALSIDRVATAFGCTKRHLHKVFADDETTLSQFIWAQRLECCREALLNPLLARHSLTQIAFMWGFNDSAHFSKVFKERFGVPPRMFRDRDRKGTAPLAAVRMTPPSFPIDGLRTAA